MMTTICMAVLAAVAAVDAGTQPDHGAFNEVLVRHVRDGLVDYAELKATRGPLDGYLDDMGAVPEQVFRQWGEDVQLAFLINLYNAATLQLIIDHYPVKSIKSIGSFFKGPWSQEVVTLFGKQITLDTLEHEIIRKDYDEPRIHFVLVCAAMGCPPLRAEAYRGATLDEQLDAQTRVFLNDAAKNRVDHEQKTLHLSPIFKWYGDDFRTETTTLQDFVAPYMDGATAITDYDIAFTDYDWSLNDQAGPR